MKTKPEDLKKNKDRVGSCIEVTVPIVSHKKRRDICLGDFLYSQETKTKGMMFHNALFYVFTEEKAEDTQAFITLKNMLLSVREDLPKWDITLKKFNATFKHIIDDPYCTFSFMGVEKKKSKKNSIQINKNEVKN